MINELLGKAKKGDSWEYWKDGDGSFFFFFFRVNEHRIVCCHNKFKAYSFAKMPSKEVKES